MLEQERSPASVNELLEASRRTAADTEQRWNDFFSELMGTEAFGQMMARSMDSYLTMQSTVARDMEPYLHALNIPTRTDVTQLVERVVLLEQKIDTMASLLGNPTQPGDDANPPPMLPQAEPSQQKFDHDLRDTAVPE